MADRTDWRTLHHETVFTAGPIHEVAIERVQLPDGRTIPDYYVVRLPDYALIYAEIDDGTVPMLRQYRHGVRRVCLAFPGGAVEQGESALVAARRELLEETGYEAAQWQSLGSFVTNANQGCNVVHLFRARSCRRISEPCSADLEETSIEYVQPATLLDRAGLREVGLASHVALLLLATHPAVNAVGVEERLDAPW